MWWSCVISINVLITGQTCVFCVHACRLYSIHFLMSNLNDLQTYWFFIGQTCIWRSCPYSCNLSWNVTTSYNVCLFMELTTFRPKMCILCSWVLLLYYSFFINEYIQFQHVDISLQKCVFCVHAHIQWNCMPCDSVVFICGVGNIPA